MAKLAKYYDVTNSDCRQSVIHLFTFLLIVARNRAPDLLEQGRRLMDSTHAHARLVFVGERTQEMHAYHANNVIFKVKPSGKRKWISICNDRGKMCARL